MNCHGNNESLHALESALQKIAEKLLESDNEMSVEEFVVRSIMRTMARGDLESSIKILKTYLDVNTKSEA